MFVVKNNSGKKQINSTPSYGLLQYVPTNSIVFPLQFISDRKMLEELLINNVESKKELFSLATAKRVIKKRKPTPINVKKTSGGFKTKKLGKMRLI